ncbi:MAG TPA: DUF488 family protein [Acidimicrobiales bacterium]|nr:DUF488 family protein [Acidimicrobiales bacterium]
MATRHVEIVRVYDDRGRAPGQYRVLVDRLWPRGLTKAAVDFDEWPKDVAPSSELRRWYGHTPERFPEFSRRYRHELGTAPALTVVDHLRQTASGHRLVLLTATRDVERSGAWVLQAVIGEGDEK